MAIDAVETASSVFSPSKRGVRRTRLDEYRGKAADAAKGILSHLAQNSGNGGAGSALKSAVAQMASVAISAAASVADGDEPEPLARRLNLRSQRVRALHFPRGRCATLPSRVESVRICGK